MIVEDLSVGLLYLEPGRPPSGEPLVDLATRKMAAALSSSLESAIHYRGVHRCSCGALSSNYDVLLFDGRTTNTLCIHYLARHREEVPQAQVDAILALPLVDEDPEPGMIEGTWRHRRAGR